MTARAAGRVCVVGSANLDLIALAERLPAPGETVMGHGFFEAAGGKGLNQAVAAARAGAAVTFVGAVGDDDAGRALVALATLEGIDTAAVRVVTDTPTGRALIAVGDDGTNTIVVVPGANGLVSAQSVGDATEVIALCDVLLLQHEVPEEATYAALRIAKAAGATTILNPAPARIVAGEILRYVDILVPNEHEYALSGDVTGVSTLVVTEGDRGARVVTPSGEVRVSPFPVDAIDTVAAGDAFCGVLAASIASGLALEQSLERASAAGALATTVRGAVPSLPTSAQVDALIASSR